VRVSVRGHCRSNCGELLVRVMGGLVEALERHGGLPVVGYDRYEGESWYRVLRTLTPLVEQHLNLLRPRGGWSTRNGSAHARANGVTRRSPRIAACSLPATSLPRLPPGSINSEVPPPTR